MSKFKYVFKYVLNAVFLKSIYISQNVCFVVFHFDQINTHPSRTKAYFCADLDTIL